MIHIGCKTEGHKAYSSEHQFLFIYFFYYTMMQQNIIILELY